MDNITSNKYSLEIKLDRAVTDTQYKTEEVISRLEAKLKGLKGNKRLVRKMARTTGR